jgi:uncharacterized protein YcnI/plastocyanin
MRRRFAVVAGTALMMGWAAALPAWGHATFQSSRKVAADSDQTVTMDVPEERGPDLHNAAIDISVPDGFAVKGCEPPAGWKCSSSAATGGASVVRFSGTGKAESFTFHVHTPAKAGDYTVPLTQTYSNGKVVHWDGPETSDTPAPILTVVPAGTNPAPGAGMPGMPGMPGMNGPMKQCAAEGTALTISALNNEFDKDCLAVPAGVPFTITFLNKDPGVPHNIVIHPMDSMTPVFRGELITGPKTAVYHVGPLKAGQYHFHCEVHKSTMYGSLVVATAAPSEPRTAAGAPMPAQLPGRGTPAAASPLPHTGSGATRQLLPVAGLVLGLGGLATMGGARHRRTRLT